MNLKRKNAIKTAVICAIALVLTFVFIIGSYAIYVFASYDRLEDNLAVIPSENPEEMMTLGREYTALTYNIGFGAYDQEFDFFLDTGYDENGKEISGSHAKAVSKGNVVKNTDGAITTVRSFSPDLVFLQEVDVESDRSHGVNQLSEFSTAFKEYGKCFANNYHSANLLYPLHDPIGKSVSGMLTLSKFRAESSLRRQLPLSDSAFDNLFDLDRCINITRYGIEGSDKQFVAINVHLSAYDEGGKVRAQQAQFLTEILLAEREKGNYVVVGGDFNHALNGNADAYVKQGGEIAPDWVAVWDVEIEGYTVRYGTSYDGEAMGTCRNNTRPYDKGWTYTCSVDGFLTSDNVTVREVINVTSHDFKFSDHNPLKLVFEI